MTIILKKGTEISEVSQKVEQSTPQKKLNARKFVGVIKLKKDALEIQNELRNEWN